MPVFRVFLTSNRKNTSDFYLTGTLFITLRTKRKSLIWFSEKKLLTAITANNIRYLQYCVLLRQLSAFAINERTRTHEN